MCSVFGLIDYNNVLSAKEKNRILGVLSHECEVRGTDATGIAYNYNGRLRIYKRPLAAHRLRFRVPNGVNVIMGHTRMATQGDAKRNYNNHPWLGKAEHAQFVLAHNGVLWNDDELRMQLPKTTIETDSYVAVQLLEQNKALDFDSLKNMAETVEGSFVFTVLDGKDNLFFVVGNNPLTIFRYEGFDLYASTSEILRKTIRRLQLGKPNEIIEPEEGEILKIDRNGHITCSSFIPHHTFSHWWRNAPYYGSYLLENTSFETDYLIDAAKAMGISEDEVQALLDYGCTTDEIEELLYDPALLHELTGELLYAY
ncbi:class II glutamine amidotransferase [Butyricicoccus sp. Marseille-Q5471]|uniref:class II glutamine amidotransferase n=1 Tax=Butyricicoccus sp. Marseille-Q5471 TaxID=3039493 RepID=UPI0024BC3D2B|nr:class II glutamine amidotransferase [Butyricicoccus sp. Marseille-Q5471]